MGDANESFQSALKMWEGGDTEKFYLAHQLDSILLNVRSILLKIFGKVDPGSTAYSDDMIRMSRLDSDTYNMVVIGLYQNTRNVLVPTLLNILSVCYRQKLKTGGSDRLFYQEWPSDEITDEMKMDYMEEFLRSVQAWGAELVDSKRLREERMRLLLPFGFETDMDMRGYDSRIPVWNLMFHELVKILQAVFEMENIIFGPENHEGDVSVRSWSVLVKRILRAEIKVHDILVDYIVPIVGAIDSATEDTRGKMHMWDMLGAVKRRDGLCDQCNAAVLGLEVRQLVREKIIPESKQTMAVLAEGKWRMTLNWTFGELNFTENVFYSLGDLHWRECEFWGEAITDSGRVPASLRARESPTDLHRTLAPWASYVNGKLQLRKIFERTIL